MLSVHLSCPMMQMSSAQEKAQPLKWCMFSLHIKIQQKKPAVQYSAVCCCVVHDINKQQTSTTTTFSKTSATCAESYRLSLNIKFYQLMDNCASVSRHDKETRVQNAQKLEINWDELSSCLSTPQTGRDIWYLKMDEGRITSYLANITALTCLHSKTCPNGVFVCPGACSEQSLAWSQYTADIFLMSVRFSWGHTCQSNMHQYQHWKLFIHQVWQRKTEPTSSVCTHYFFCSFNLKWIKLPFCL